MSHANDNFKYLPGKRISHLSLNEYVIGREDGHPATLEYVGKKGKNFYSYELLALETEQEFPEYDHNTYHDASRFLGEKTEQGGVEKERAEAVLDRIADGLAFLFHSLRTGAPDSRDRNELTDDDWDFWKKCTRVFLAGGPAGKGTKDYFEQRINETLGMLGDHGLAVSCYFDDALRTLSLAGCAAAAFSERLGEKHSSSFRSGETGLEQEHLPGTGSNCYVFDFGNTAFKCGCAVYENGGCRIEEHSPVIHEDFDRLPDTAETAEKIHRMLMDTILETVRVRGQKEEGLFVSLCMANNVAEGVLANRGSFRSLRLLAPSYERYLRQSLEKAPLNCSEKIEKSAKK